MLALSGCGADAAVQLYSDQSVAERLQDHLFQLFHLKDREQRPRGCQRLTIGSSAQRPLTPSPSLPSVKL